MRKLIWLVDMSLDGYMSGRNGELHWMAGTMDAEMWEYVNELLSTVDTVLFGRATYQDFERYWPAAGRNPKNSKNELDFSKWIDSMPKIVASTTMKKVEWENSSMLPADVAEGMSSIKAQPGKNILIFGSCNFAATLLEGGLIDEMRMRIHPVILGAGRPLFQDGRARRKLKLVESRAFQTGVVGLRYEVAPAKIIGDNSKRGKERDMSRVRVLVGTRKGAFILESDGKREKWDVSGPHFAGWELYHLKGSPVDPNRIYASQTSGWFGQIIQQSDDGGKTWHQPGTPSGEVPAPGPPKAVSNKFVYDATGETGKPLTTHQWYDGTQHPWEFKRVWHLEPSLSDADTVYAGVEDAAIFRSTDGGQNWKELSGLRGHDTGPMWQPGAGGMCLHTIILDPSNPQRIVIAISAAGAFRTDDGGKTWKPINKGLYSKYIPDPTAAVGHCVHHIAMNPRRSNVLFMQKHWDVMRSDDAGDSWREISGNLPTDFGFVIDVHSHEPETVYVVPIKSDGEHFVPDGKLRVFRSRTGGNEWEALTKGLPQKDCYVNILRDAMAVDTLDKCGIYFGTSGGQVYASADAGDSWNAIVRDLPGVLSVEVQTLA